MTAPDFWHEHLSTEQGYVYQGAWAYYLPDKPVQGWKFHLYSTDLSDWKALCQLILPYCQAEQIPHKTLSTPAIWDQLMNDPMQHGKTLTVYHPTMEGFCTLAQVLDQMLTQSERPCLTNTAITGDAAYGKSGRLFYRYDLDAQGSYRPNDGYYKPGDIPDPLI